MLKKNNDESSEFQSELDENNKLLQEYYNDQMQRQNLLSSERSSE